MTVDLPKDSLAAAVTNSRSTARPYLTALFCALFAIMYLDRVNISAAAGAIQKEFGLSTSDLGFVFSAFSWAYLASVLFGGWCARRYGSRLTLAVTVLIVGFGTIAAGFAFNIASLFAARLAVGLGEGPAFPAATQAMRNWYPAERFGYIQGITHSASRLGGALAPVLIAWMIVTWNWRISFFVSGGAAIAWTAAWLIYFLDDPRDHKLITASDLQGLDIVLPDRKARTPIGALTRRMFPVTIVMFAYGWSYWMFLSWLPLYFQNRHGADLKTSSMLASVTLLAGVLGNIAGGVASDAILRSTGKKRLARNGVVAFSLTGAALCLVPCAFVSDLWAGVALLSAAMFFLELTIAPIYAIPMDISRDYSGMGSAYIIMGVAIAGILSPLAFGRIIDATHNWDIPFVVGVGILLAGALISLTLRPDRNLDAPSHLVASQ